MIYEYFLSYGGPELVMLFTIFIITPIYFRLFLRKASSRTRWYSVGGLWAVAFIAVYWDVVYIAFKARELCREQAGLHVYKTVPDRSLVGIADIRGLSKHDIKFVEHSSPAGINKYKFSMRNGEVIKEEIQDFVSNVEYFYSLHEESKVFLRTTEGLLYRSTGEILGELITYSIYPGWVDRRLIGLTGLAWSPPHCDGKFPPKSGRSGYYVSDLIGRVMAKV